VLAHRGASRRARENTLEAFALASELGADGVELDVRRTADGVLVVHHDPEAAGVGLLAAATFVSVRDTRPDIPTLAEALDACAGLLVNVELKCLPWEPDADPDGDVVRATAELVRDCGCEVVVSSFDIGTVDAMRSCAPEVPTGWLTYGRDPADAAAIAHEHGHPWVHPDRAAVLTETRRSGPDGRRSRSRPVEGVVELIRGLGISVNVWTVDEPAEIRTLASAGVDALITNVPDVALDALA
jgi:glycerophosphoryl diester phosphodiesterase